VIPFTGPFSTSHHKRYEQVNFLTRYPIGRTIKIVYLDPDKSQKTVEMTSVYEVESFLATLPYQTADPVELPIVAETLPGGATYIRIPTFSGDMSLMTRIWEHYIEALIENGSNGLIIDVRSNFGGSGHLAANFAAYFFDEEFDIGRHGYYSETLGEFEFDEEPVTIDPAPIFYDGPIIVLVSQNCISACEGFAYYMSINNRATIIGHYPSSGAFGEVGQGQYSLPGDISVQFPTGRPETSNGNLLIEGTGVIPDLLVPVTRESVLGLLDSVLETAINLLK
jgi:C-terminal processing protease CtpA/Prc